MNLTKQREFFDPSTVKERIHIVGCGSVGSTVAENLARCGIMNFDLWDFDTVESKNICNQMFLEQQVGTEKVEALTDLLCAINPLISNTVKKHREGWNGRQMSGYIFLCVDSIEIRRAIVEKVFNNMNVRAVFDFRTGLTTAQHYGADWSDLKQKENLKASMEFSHEEAKAETPTSACGEVLGVATTVRIVSALGVNNFIRFVKGEKIWKMVTVDGFNGEVEAF